MEREIEEEAESPMKKVYGGFILGSERLGTQISLKVKFVIFKGCSKFGDEPSYHRKEERKITALTIIKKTPIVTR